MNAEKAIELLQQLSDQSPAYRETFVTLIIPALKELPPTQEVDYKFFLGKEAPQFKHLNHLGKTEWINVIIGANDWVIDKNTHNGLDKESDLTVQVREWIGYKPITKNATDGITPKKSAADNIAPKNNGHDQEIASR